MPKANPLAQAINQKSSHLATSDIEPAQPRATKPAGGRAGRVLVGGFYAVEVQKTLKILAAEEGSTVQALLAEGIDMVFAKRGKPQIATMPGRIIAAS